MPRPAPTIRETEAGYQAAVEQAAGYHGWQFWHCRIPLQSRAGMADLILWHPRTGVLAFVELKTEAGRLRPEQAVMLAELDALSTYAGAAIVRPSHWDAVVAFLRDPLAVGRVPGERSRGPPR